MAPLPVITDVMRVSLNWQETGGSGATAANVMHFSAFGMGASALATAIDAHVTASMWGHTYLNSRVPFFDVTPLDGTSATFRFVTGIPSKWEGGGSSSDPILAACALLKLQTNARGRSFRGRIYLPFVSELNNNSGTLNPTTLTSMQTAWNNFQTAMTAAGAPLVLASYKLADSFPLTAITVESSLATQRRRQRR